MLTAPPTIELAVVLPAVIAMLPPLPEAPSPTDKEMAPPRPTVADPVLILRAPLLPWLAVPEASRSRPDAPAAPASAVRIDRGPLEVAVPLPVEIVTAPPVKDDAPPAAKSKLPPAPLVPLPTVIEMDPPWPLVALPDPM
jgi:hypothetical protein